MSHNSPQGSDFFLVLIIKFRTEDCISWIVGVLLLSGSLQHVILVCTQNRALSCGFWCVGPHTHNFSSHKKDRKPLLSRDVPVNSKISTGWQHIHPRLHMLQKKKSASRGKSYARRRELKSTMTFMVIPVGKQTFIMLYAARTWQFYWSTKH